MRKARITGLGENISGSITRHIRGVEYARLVGQHLKGGWKPV